MVEIQIFVAQFSLIFLLGCQSLTVNRGHKVLAAIISLLLGVAGFKVTGIVASAYSEGTFTTVWWSFIIAGPLGIITSMWAHPKIVKFFH